MFTRVWQETFCCISGGFNGVSDLDALQRRVADLEAALEACDAQYQRLCSVARVLVAVVVRLVSRRISIDTILSHR